MYERLPYKNIYTYIQINWAGETAQLVKKDLPCKHEDMRFRSPTLT